jgi:hypothetical protein
MPDYWSMLVRQRYALPEEWRWFSLEALGDYRQPREHSASLIKGGVYKTLKQRGKNKGKPDIKKPEPGTYREVVVTFADFDAFCVKWERESGRCYDCYGNGDQCCGSAIQPDGSVKHAYRTCVRCKGSGKPVAKGEP